MKAVNLCFLNFCFYLSYFYLKNKKQNENENKEEQQTLKNRANNVDVDFMPPKSH